MIKQAILHIFDFETGMHILSQQPLALANEEVREFVRKQVQMLQTDLAHKQASIGASSRLLPLLTQYKIKSLDFTQISLKIAELFIEELNHCDGVGDHDLLVVEAIVDELPQLAVVLLARKSAYTHQVYQDEVGARNEIIRHQAILPSSSQKPTTYLLIQLASQTVTYRDRKRSYDGEKCYVLPEYIIECENEVQSPKETLRTVNKIVADLAIAHDLQPSVSLAKVKECLVAVAEKETTFDAATIADVLFVDKPEIQQAFKAQLIEKAVPEQVEIAPQVAQRTGKMHTIKTDSGIEIRVPSNIVSNADYIEFINNPDGTIAIQIRNIAKITDK